nr:peptidase M50 [Mycobacterium sp.]
MAQIDAVLQARRIVVVGADTDLATVLTKLLRADRLAVEVAFVPRWHTGRRALLGAARRVPLIRDETGAVLVGAAYWLPPDDSVRVIEGEAVVDDVVLFDGSTTAVRIEPIDEMPGLRASALSTRMRPRRWVTGRAAQLGSPGALVVSDGIPSARPVQRSTFYRHTEGWLSVR